MRNNKGQNMIEYIMLIMAVLLVCIYFFLNKSNSAMPLNVNSSLTSIVNDIDAINSQIKLPTLQ